MVSFEPLPPTIVVDSHIYKPAALVTLMVFVPSNSITRSLQVLFKMAL